MFHKIPVSALEKEAAFLCHTDPTQLRSLDMSDMFHSPKL